MQYDIKVEGKLYRKNVFVYMQNLDFWTRGPIGVGEGVREDNGGKYG